MWKALITVCLLGSSGMLMAENMADKTDTQQSRFITVSGSGTADAQPDRATIRMSIVTRQATLAAAQEEAARVTGEVLKMTDKLDIDRDQVDTTGASVRADYRWNRDREEQELRGYFAERQTVVDTDELDKLGAIVEGAVDAGVNQVTPPQLDSSQRAQAHRQALALAAEDAQANAEQLARSLGTFLGQVLQVQAGNHTGQPPQPHPGVRAMSADSSAVESYNAADLTFSASVTVTFALVD